MNEMIERAAIALYVEAGMTHLGTPEASWRNDMESKREWCRRLARAALAAMRETGFDLSAKVERDLPRGGVMLPGASVREAWNAVIDEVLK